MLDKLLDLVKSNYTVSLGNNDIDITYKGIVEDTSYGKREEYTIVRWINKNEPRESS